MTDALERIVNLALFLASSREPVTAERIRTEVFGYPEGQDDAAFQRMFERDKDDLKRTGLAIESDTEGNYRLDSAATYASAIDLTPAEASAVRIVGAAMVDDPSFPFASDLRLAMAKVCAEVDTGEASVCGRLADEEPERQGEAVSVLSTATSNHKRVRFGYTNSLGRSAEHEVEPYGLFLHDGRWYLVGHDVAKSENRTYAVARMRTVSANASAPKSPDFEPPADFDVARYVRLPFQFGPREAQFTAELRFSPEASWRARGLAAGQGELRPLGDGALVWRVRARSVSRLLRFAIENGPGIRIIGPPELTAELHRGMKDAERVHG